MAVAVWALSYLGTKQSVHQDDYDENKVKEYFPMAGVRQSLCHEP